MKYRHETRSVKHLQVVSGMERKTAEGGFSIWDAAEAVIQGLEFDDHLRIATMHLSPCCSTGDLSLACAKSRLAENWLH